MAQSDLPALPDFSNIRKCLESERKTIIKVNKFSADDDDYIRSEEDADIILTFLENVQSQLNTFFTEFPSLVPSFNKDFLPLHEFYSHSYIIETIFLDDCLISEKEMFLFGQDGGISDSALKMHEQTFEGWIEDRKKSHKESQEIISTSLTMEMKSAELPCGCVACIADYRGKLRDIVFKFATELAESCELEMKRSIDAAPLHKISDLYQTLQRDLDKLFRKVRNRLKRSTLNRLENQVKSKNKDIFTYPSELALQQEKNLIPFYKGWLVEQELKEDLLSEAEYKRFFNQLGTNIWRGESYLKREFQKQVKGILIFKRKDISGTILQEYLGEFWLHSQARSIKRKIVYHMGPTNSGKTYHAIEKVCSVKTGCYLAPLRLLAAELYDTMNTKGVLTTLLTGEEVIEIEGSTHYSSTIEMARLQEHFDVAVIDEIQMITDRQRGWAWTRALVNISADEVHVCGDPSVLDLVKNIVELCGDELEIKNYERMTKLEVEKKPLKLGDLDRADALIVFSRRNALKYKMDLERLNFKVSIVYGRLSPEVRREQARKFDQGETDILVSTDAIAMGMNLPIKRVVFSTLTKFFNAEEHLITESEIKQIAGRAGRYQRFPTGYANCLEKVEDGLHQINASLKMTLDQKSKCMVGPDLDIFSQVNGALEENSLPVLRLSEFLRLFNTMTFQKPFYCVELKEMIEVAEMVEEADHQQTLTTSEIFGFACAPVNLGLMEHVQYFVYILNNYAQSLPINFERIEARSADIDYLETSIKCVELFQWLSRHFNNKNFEYDEVDLIENKIQAVEKLNLLLSDKIVPTCSSCGAKLEEKSKFAICEVCFKKRRFSRPRRGFSKDSKDGSGNKSRGGKKPNDRNRKRPGTRKRKTEGRRSK